MSHLSKFARYFFAATIIAAVSGSIADAAVNTAVYSGTVRSGFDLGNVFGYQGQSLVGMQATATYTWDDSLGQITRTGFGQTNVGGHGDDGASPIIAANVKVGNGHYSMDSVDISLVQSMKMFSQHSAYNNAGGIDSYSGWTAQPGFTLWTDYVLPIQGYTSVDVLRDGKTVAYLVIDDTYLKLTYANSNLPEPGTWLLMIAGMFGVGACLRRKSGNIAVS